MIPKQYPTEEINRDNYFPTGEEKRENESRHEEGESLQENEDDLPGYASCAVIINALGDAYKKDRALHKKLLYYTLKQVRLFFRRDCAGILTVEDIIQEVLESLINQQRKWYKEKTPNIINLVLMSIVSYVRNEFKNEKSKKKLDYIDQYDEDGKLNEHNLPDLLRSYLHSGDEEFIGRIDELKQKCFGELEEKNDVEGYYVLEEIINNTYTTDTTELNIKIAKNLDIPVTDVEKAKKRIRRTAKKIRF